jgi:hypothetical protein
MPLIPVRKVTRIALEAVEVDMEVQEDVRTGTGLLLLAAGQTVTPALRQRLANVLRLNAVFGTVRVLLAPSNESSIASAHSDAVTLATAHHAPA